MVVCYISNLFHVARGGEEQDIMQGINPVDWQLATKLFIRILNKLTQRRKEAEQFFERFSYNKYLKKMPDFQFYRALEQLNLKLLPAEKQCL